MVSSEYGVDSTGRSAHGSFGSASHLDADVCRLFLECLLFEALELLEMKQRDRHGTALQSLTPETMIDIALCWIVRGLCLSPASALRRQHQVATLAVT